MSLLTGLRDLSENALEQLADRFPDLPTPVLAAIGAGDMTAERLAELRDTVSQADVPGAVAQIAGSAPGQAQKLLTTLPTLPARAGEAAQSVSTESVRETVLAYAKLAGVVYENLARRGGQSWARTRTAGLLDVTASNASRDRVRHERASTHRASERARATGHVTRRDATAGTPPGASGTDAHPRSAVDAPVAPTRKPRTPRAQAQTRSDTGAPTGNTAAAIRTAAARSTAARAAAAKTPGTTAAHSTAGTTAAAKAGTDRSRTPRPGAAGTAKPGAAGTAETRAARTAGTGAARQRTGRGRASTDPGQD